MSNLAEKLEVRPTLDENWSDYQYRALMCGMGDDTAMLIAEMFERRFEPDELIFCDTGSEFPHTYRFIEAVKAWSIAKKWSKVTVLKKVDKFKQPLSVISLCQAQNTLPAVAFGAKSCSLRFKFETANKYFNNNPKCWKAWGVKKKGQKINTYTGKILRIVGLNADEPKRVAGWVPDDKWMQCFPLFDWSIGEAESTAVERVGLYYPGKSSCTVCPNMTHPEIAMLRDNYPDIYEQSLAIENNYREITAPKSDQLDMFGNVTFQNDIVGLGREKTWPQMMREYDANPHRYKRMTDNKPCECGH